MFKEEQNTYFIAEVGVNHEGSLETAFMLIDQAADAGASAVKFQAYQAGKLAAKNSPAYWDQSKEKSATQFELFQKYDSFSASEYEQLAAHCTSKGVDFCCTPFDVDCLEWLAPLLPFVKIASADVTNALLLDAIADLKKPVVMSVGAASIEEIEAALKILEKSDQQVVLLHCVLNYPTPLENGFLHRIPYLKKHFPEYEIGYSDHIAPASASDDQLIIAKSLGTRIFEKHFTHDKTLPGNDHYHAMDQHDLKSLINRFKNVDQMLRFDCTEKEFLSAQQSAIKNARRSLFYARDMSAGEIIKRSDLIAKRPAFGLSPMRFQELLGKQLVVDVLEDNIVVLTDVDLS